MEDNKNNQLAKILSEENTKQESNKPISFKKRWQKETQEYSKSEFKDLLNFQYADTQALKDIYSYRPPVPKKMSAQWYILL